MEQSRVRIKIANIEKQLFIANIVDTELRGALLYHPIDLWDTIGERLEQDTGVFLTRNEMKSVLYMFLYRASPSTVLRNINMQKPLDEEILALDDVVEISDWLKNISTTPYLHSESRISSATLRRDFNRAIFERYNSTCTGLSFSFDEIHIYKPLTTQRALLNIVHGALLSLGTVMSPLECNTEGLFTTDIDQEVING